MENNKKNGTKFEKEICNILYEAGFWTRPMYPAPDGSQPFDVMAINDNGDLFCIECKDCKSERFVFSRLEDNQLLMYSNLYSRMKTNRIFFAFKIKENIYFLEIGKLCSISFFNKKCLNENEIENASITIDEFIKLFKNTGGI